MLLRIPNQLLSRNIRWWFAFVIVIVVAIAIGTFRIGFIRSLNLVIGSLFILFFPGWWTSFIFFPLSGYFDDRAELPSRRTLDIVERLTLAVALSIIISSGIALVLYNLLLGSKLTPKNLIVATALLNLMIFAASAWRKRRNSL